MIKTGSLSGIIFNFIVVIFLISAQGLQAGEEEAKAYTLDECIRIALENNWSVKAQEEKISENEFARDGAKSGFYPELSMSYSYTRIGDEPTVGDITVGDKNTFQWKGTIKQNIFKGYSVTSTYELAKLGIDASNVALELEKLDLALFVKEGYFDILKADKSVEVAKSAVESLESHSALAKIFYETGMTPKNDMLKAEVELANAQYDYIKAQNEATIARASFNVLLSRSEDESIDVVDILAYTPETPDFNASIEKALKERPEIKSLNITDEQVDQQITLAKSKYYPEADFTFDYIKAGDTPLVNGSDYEDANSWQTKVGVTWTLWDGQKTKSSVRQNESIKRQLSQTRKTLEDNIRLELKKAVLHLKEAEQKIPTAKKAVDQAEENLRVSEERYKVQATTSTEVLDAQTLLSQARMNYYNALYDHHLAKASLLRAVGEY